MTTLDTINEQVNLSKVSPKYSLISTKQIVSELETYGWTATQVSKHKSGKHLVRLRHTSSESDMTTTGAVPELILRNSFGGECSFEFMLGMYRFACANGLIVGDTFESVKVRHIGFTMKRVAEAQERILCQFDTITKKAKEYSLIDLSPEQQTLFCIDALVSVTPIETVERYFTESNVVELAPYLNKARRTEDVGSNLWLTYNRVQEAIMSGDYLLPTDKTKTGVRKARAIKSQDKTVIVNRALWNILEKAAA